MMGDFESVRDRFESSSVLTLTRMQAAFGCQEVSLFVELEPVCDNHGTCRKILVTIVIAASASTSALSCLSRTCIPVTWSYHLYAYSAEHKSFFWISFHALFFLLITL